MRRDWDLLVFSHLRWDFVYQRPQHLLARLAKKRRVFFVEEPVHADAAEPSWETTNPEPNVFVCRPRFPLSTHGFTDENLSALKCLLPCLLRENDMKEYVVWFYSPLAVPMAEALTPRAVVFDCMDELSAFLHAPKQLLDREAELLRRADVVFTGG